MEVLYVCIMGASHSLDLARDVDSSDETVKNLRQTNFEDNAVESPVNSCNNLGVFERI